MNDARSGTTRWLERCGTLSRIDGALQKFWAGSADELDVLAGQINGDSVTFGTCRRLREAIDAIQSQYEGRLVA